MIVDTNALSAWFAGDEDLRPQLERARRVVLSPVVLGEFRFGLLSSRHRASAEDRLAALESDLPVLAIDEVTAQHYATLRRELSQKGKPIPWHDLWIAAQARQHRMSVLSRDAHFDLVSGLERVSW